MYFGEYPKEILWCAKNISPSKGITWTITVPIGDRSRDLCGATDTAWMGKVLGFRALFGSWGKDHIYISLYCFIWIKFHVQVQEEENNGRIGSCKEKGCSCSSTERGFNCSKAWGGTQGIQGDSQMQYLPWAAKRGKLFDSWISIERCKRHGMLDFMIIVQWDIKDSEHNELLPANWSTIDESEDSSPLLSN